MEVAEAEEPVEAAAVAAEEDRHTTWQSRTVEEMTVEAAEAEDPVEAAAVAAEEVAAEVAVDHPGRRERAKGRPHSRRASDLGLQIASRCAMPTPRERTAPRARAISSMFAGSAMGRTRAKIAPTRPRGDRGPLVDRLALGRFWFRTFRLGVPGATGQTPEVALPRPKGRGVKL